jgi:NAD kinase
MRTGFGVDTLVGRVEMLEDSSGKVINETDSTDGFAAEAYTVDAAGLVIATQAGSTSGSASILNGVTTT